MKSYPSQPCMSSETGLNAQGKKSDALAHSKHAEYTEYELIMNQIKAALNDHVSENSEIFAHVVCRCKDYVCHTVYGAALMASVDAVLCFLGSSQ